MIQWLTCTGIRSGERYDFVNGHICGRKLLLFDLKYGLCEFETKCPRCNAINEFAFNQPKVDDGYWSFGWEKNVVVGFNDSDFKTSLTNAELVRLTGVWKNE